MISEKEVGEALKKLKNGTAAGEDGILTEILKGGGEVMVRSLTKMFNKVWEEENSPEGWGKGIIVALYKDDGDMADPGNYRGIALLSIVGKLFGRVINKRLMEWVEKNEVVEEQAGFRPKRGCVDQLFILTEVIQRRLVEGKPTYLAFIDVRKAYDRVWRDGLWKRVWDAGIQGKMWRMLRAMYEKAQSCVMVEGELSDWFVSEIGVRQGCVLSPVLYSIFINGFAKTLINSSIGGVEVGGEVLQMLLFADDIVLFADSASQLQKMLEVMEGYCKKWRFEVNTKKSQVMVCGEENEEFEWMFNGKSLVKVDEYKYLGLSMTSNGLWVQTIERLLGVSQRRCIGGLYKTKKSKCECKV